MKDKIQAAFDGIRADEALKNSTAAYLAGELAPYQKSHNRSAFAGRAGALAAVAATVLIAAMFSYRLYFVPDAYVSIDVNPSVELTLNKLDKVIATHAFNGDGARILSEVSLRGERYDTAAGLLMSRIESAGYFSDDALVSVTVRTEGGDRQQKLCASLQRVIDARVLPRSADLEVFPVSEEVWSHAHGDHVSPAKYLAIQELLEVDAEATVQDYDDSTIPMIRQRVQECRNAHGTMSGTTASESESSQGHMMNGHMHGRGHRGHG